MTKKVRKNDIALSLDVINVKDPGCGLSMDAAYTWTFTVKLI